MSEKVELELKLKGGDKAVKTLGQLEQELDQARQAIKEVEVGSDAFNKLADKIQKAGSEVKTLEKKMEGLEPQQKAEAFLKMGEGIAGGFAVAQGAMALAGVESEDLEKLQVKVQSAIAIAQGIRMMSEAALMATTAKRVVLEKLALVREKAGIAITYARAAATGVWATAQGVLTGAVSATTAGLKLLRLAIAATGIGALVLAITAIGIAVYNWATATDAAAEAQAKLNEKLAKGNETYLKRRDHIKNLQAAETENEKQLVKRTKRLNEHLEELKKNSERLKENAEKIKNLSDFSKEEQKQIKAKSVQLQLHNEDIKRGIDLLDKKIAKTKEDIAADEEAAQKASERAAARKQRREEQKAQREKDAEDLRALQEEEKRLTLERIADEETRELALLKFEKDLQLEKIKDATNFEEQRLIIEERYARKREDIIKEHTQAEIDGLVTLTDEAQELYAESLKKYEKWQDEERAKWEKRQQNKKDFKASMDTQGFELAKALGGKNEKLQKNLAIAETAFFTGKSIMRAVSDIPAPWGLIQAGIHGAMGIAQIANIKSEKIGGASGGGGGTDITEPMLPSSTGAFSLGGAQEQPAVKAFVVESEITDSQAQMADINRRSTI